MKDTTEMRRAGVGPGGVVFGILAGVVLLAAALRMYGGVEPSGAVWLAVLLAVAAGVRIVWREWPVRFTPLAAAVFAYVLWNGAASLYAPVGSFAAREFAKVLAGLCVFGLVWLLTRRDKLDCLAGAVAAVTGFIGLLSVDASSAGALTRPFMWLAARMRWNYTDLSTGYEAGTRVTGIFGNANILAGILAMGIFLSLYLTQRAETKRGTALAAAVLAVNAISFFLAFSMGAMGVFALCVVLYFLAAGRGRRAELAFTMVQTVVCTVVCAFAAFAGLGHTGGRGWLALGAVVLNVVLVAGVQLALGGRVGPWFARRGKAAIAALCALVVCIGGYAALAMNLTGSAALDPGERISRAAYLAPGEYTFDFYGEGSVSYTIESQTRRETMMQTRTLLSDGSTGSFTVPEGSIVVWFTFTAGEQRALLHSAVYSGAERGTVKLGYTLLPEFAANRLQGLRANQNAIQRTVFFQDGMKLFAQSPLVGLGLGGFQARLLSVQDFYYQTKYVHNHYIQLLAETGVVGLGLFLAMLAAGAARLIRLLRKKGEDAPLAAALLACLAMMAGHAAVEVDWSTAPFLVVAFAVLGMIAKCGEAETEETGQVLAKSILAAAQVPVLVFAVLLGLHVSADKAYQEVAGEWEPYTVSGMESLIRKDVYGRDQYKLYIAAYSATSSEQRIYDKATRYAEEVRAKHVCSMDLGLAEYTYFARGEEETGFAVLLEGLADGASDPANWQKAFDLLKTCMADSGDPVNFAKGVLEVYDAKTAYEEDHWETIPLTEENENFIATCRALAEMGA